MAQRMLHCPFTFTICPAALRPTTEEGEGGGDKSELISILPAGGRVNSMENMGDKVLLLFTFVRKFIRIAINCGTVIVLGRVTLAIRTIRSPSCTVVGGVPRVQMYPPSSVVGILAVCCRSHSSLIIVDQVFNCPLSLMSETSRPLSKSPPSYVARPTEKPRGIVILKLT